MNALALGPTLALSGGSASYRNTDRPFMKHFRFMNPVDEDEAPHFGAVALAWAGVLAQMERFATSRTQADIRALQELRDNWDGQGSQAPKAAAISRALTLLPTLFMSASGAEWRAPLVSSSEEGVVTFEWWWGNKKLTLYIDSDVIEYVKVWGPDMDTEMSVDRLGSADGFSNLWAWLSEL